MSFKQTPPNKVTFFKHFPHYFLRPYDAQIHFNQQDFLEKLSARNCEWMTRPKIAMSEAAQALRTNWDIFKGSELIDATTRTTLESIIGPVLPHLANLNSKEKTSNPTEEDVYQVMRWCLSSPDLDTSLSLWMQESAALFVFITQLRAMRGLFMNPQQYSMKLVDDSQHAVEFKTTKTVTSLQKMLTSACVSAVPLPETSSAAIRQLATQLVNPSPASSMASALQPPVTHAPSSTVAQQPNSTSTGFTNQLMDMILQLQGQMQAMQQQQALSQQTTAEQVEKEEATQERRKRKRKVVIEEEDENPSVNEAEASTSSQHHLQEQVVEQPQVQTDNQQAEEQKPRKKSRKQKKKKD